MPTLAWASDIHLDHAGPATRDSFLREVAGVAGPLVITGDISVAARLVPDLEAIAAAAAGPVRIVLGNHDHYGGSVAAVRDAVLGLAEPLPGFGWLPPLGVVPLATDWVLVGVDGWADGRHGDPIETPIWLNDDRLIAEIAAQPTRRRKLAVKQALADADAVRLGILLERAAAAASNIVVATHVPPFLEALPSSGRLAGPEWWPWLICEATGAMLKAAALAQREHHYLVLAGHTHVACDVRILPNLRCVVAGARYGEPLVRQLRLER